MIPKICQEIATSAYGLLAMTAQREHVTLVYKNVHKHISPNKTPVVQIGVFCFPYRFLL